MWVYRLGVLASFDLLNSKWEVVQNMPPKLVKVSFLFCFVLFCFVLFCFVLFCFVLFCFVLFCFVLF